MQNFERVLVTGGAGFIGNRVVSGLSGRGTMVGVVDNLLVKMPMPALSAHVQPYLADIRDANRIKAVLAEFRPDAIVHLAALHHIPSCEQQPREAMDVNVVGTQTILDAAAEAGVSHMVLASSAAVYSFGNEALVEDKTPLEATDVYSIGKLTNEAQLRLWAARHGGKGGIARIFNVIGHDDPNGHIIPDILVQIDTDNPTVRLGNTAPKRDYTHADDTAKGIIALLDHVGEIDGTEAFNLSRGEEFSVTDLIASMGRFYGCDIAVEHDPARVRRVDRLHLLGDTAKTRRILGWQAEISFDQAIHRILAQLKPELTSQVQQRTA